MRASTNLDMLRAIAVIFVVTDHSLKFFGHPLVFGVDARWIGSLGVMFFFVHTCMVLMMSLERRDGKFNTPQFIGNFYLRRIFRIYPLSIFAIAVVMLFSIPAAKIESAFTIIPLVPTKMDLLLNILLMQNIFHATSIIAPLWSLPFEVQMYVLLPFIYLFLARKRKLGWLFSLWALSWVAEYLLEPHSLFLAHFIPGVIAYVILRGSAKTRLPGWLWPVLLVSLTLVFLALKPSYLTGGIVCLFLGLSLSYFEDIRYRYINLVTHNIAKYSYGVYLSHMFCLWFAFIHFKSMPRTVQSSIFMVCLIAIPILLFHLVEDPMIRTGATLADRLFTAKPAKNTPVSDVQPEQLEVRSE